ncbi:hypothetical protein ElyMa_002151700 [Elysia marginata]|uniref:Uncharacterized protein n=1 Tax=Elysia marginata TaxID=1093978 RepID=A0AAV4FL23_9GAST|nr:hypothetical protein ElyMa_002151700 [Elysia marginata]
MDKSTSIQPEKRPRVALVGKRGAESVFSPLAPQRIYLNVESVGRVGFRPVPLQTTQRNNGNTGRRMQDFEEIRGVLELARKSGEEKLTTMKELGGIKVKVARDTYLNNSRGVINHKDLRGSKEEGLVECIPGVISARRIEIKRGRRGSRRIHTSLPTTPPPHPLRLRQDTCLSRAHNGGTFGQARAAVAVEVAKEVRPRLYAQAMRGGPARRVTAPLTTQNKTESLTMAQNSATKKARPINDKPRTGETRKPQTFERYGTNPEVDLESIDSIWSVPKDFCRAGRRAGGTSPPCPAPRRQSSPSQQPSPSQQSPLFPNPPRAPAPEESDSGDMDTDLGSALSADPGRGPLSPLVLIRESVPLPLGQPRRQG